MNAPHDYGKLHKNSVKEQKYMHMQSLFFVFSKAEDVF
jgi:hypothetical protein